MKKQVVNTRDAVGLILGHDITRIVQGEFKGSLFKKGHLIEEKDVEKLLDVGKNNIYVLTLDEGDVHENDAGIRLGNAIAGTGTYTEPPKESRVNIFAAHDGLLVINEEAVYRINDEKYALCSTILPNVKVEKGQMVAATKVVPLVVSEEDVSAVERICRESGDVVSVLPFRKMKVGCVITGSEVYQNRVEDAFASVLQEKIDAYGSEIIGIEYAPDDASMITARILEMKQKGAELIIATGGMSVDPDDKTPSAILDTGAELVKQGSPVLPGAMFLVAYLEDTPILGVPAAGMYFKNTMLDRMLPYVFAGVKIKRSDIVGLGVGGLIQGNQRY